MARLSSKFSALPNNKIARKRTYRNARMGTRPVPRDVNVGDALKTMTTVSRYREAFEREKPNIDFFRVLSDSWAARKDWRP